MSNPEEKNKIDSFLRRHPVLFNLLLIFLVGCGLIWVTLVWLDSWTLHGKTESVPDIRGLSYSQARQALAAADLRVELSDSLYDPTIPPGNVIEQSPRPRTKVKPQRVIYLTINAFSPKMVTVPPVTDMSLRQARSILESLGLKSIKVSYVPGEFRDLVTGVKFNGLPLQPGAKIPVTAVLTIEVSEGYSEDSDSLEIHEPLTAEVQ